MSDATGWNQEPAQGSAGAWPPQGAPPPPAPPAPPGSPPPVNPGWGAPPPPVSPGAPGAYGYGLPGQPPAPGPYAYSYGAGSGGGGRISRALRLVGDSFRILRQEPGLLVVAAVAGVINVALLGLGILAVASMSHGSGTGGGGHVSAGGYAVAVLMGIAILIVSILAQATIVIRVMALLQGHPISNSQACSMALSKSPHLIAFAVLSYVVRSLIQQVARQGILGMVFGTGLRVAWQIATFFAVPVIVFENLGPFAAVKRSAALCRQRWGEEVVGQGAFGIIGLLGIAVLFLVGLGLGLIFAPLGAVVAGLGFIGLLLVLTAASATFQAALYLFAVSGQAPPGFATGDLVGAFAPRRRRSSLL